MPNKWNIPEWLEDEVRRRDQRCVYCGVKFTSARESPISAATWEHIINDARIVTRENICLCCRGCNSSKGQKQLSAWLQSEYCRKHGITFDTVAPIIQRAIKNGL